MAESNKVDTSKSHTIRWDATLWEKVEAAARVLSYRQRLSGALPLRGVNPTEIIRAGASRFADEILTGSPEIGVETQESAERAGDAANADRNVQERRRLDDRRIDRAS